MNADPGSLEIELALQAGRLAAVRIDGSRPDVSRALVGRTPESALELIGRLFTICGRAQRAAAELALGAAAGDPVTKARCISLARMVAHEAVQEHLWRLLLDWPRQLCVESDVDSFRHWYRAADPERQELPAASLRGALEQDWLGVPLRELCRFDLEATRAWTAREHKPIPQVIGALLGQRGDSPARSGIAPHESGAIIRVERCPWITSLLNSCPLAARVAARVIDLGALLAALENGDDLEAACQLSATRLGPNRGRGEAIVARGLLCHEVELHGDRIRSYTLTAPTDGNFSVNGAYNWHVRRECPLDAATALRLGELWALALDPCVQYRVFMGSAGNA